MPSPIQIALALEATANILGGTFMLLSPHRILAALTTTTSTPPSSTTIVLFQWLAVLVFGLTPQLLLGIPNSKTAVEKRRMSYITLGACEVALILMMVWQIVDGKEEEEGGLTRKALCGCVAGLVPFLGWRAFALGRVGWMEGGKGGKRE
ncbi:MAG: hypothetical protein Q9220_006286 [cf. Caloplaca sp. 1 TL-2023]